VDALTATRIARWNGAAWSALGSGAFRPSGGAAVNALALSGNDLYLGGTFYLAGGKVSVGLAHWNEQKNFDASLQLGAAHRLPDGSFQFTVSASNVNSYAIEATTNFGTWLRLATGNVSSASYTDSNAPAFPARFYRARQIQ